MPEEKPELKTEKRRRILRYVGIPALVTLIASGISGTIGYGFNEFTKDRKVLEVTSTSSGNLASIPVGVAGNLEILLPVSNTRKEAIRSLYRYEVKIVNKTEQGADQVMLFVESPKGIELVTSPEITTVPPELVAAVTVTHALGPLGNPQLTINLINPSQTIKVGYLGFSRDLIDTDNMPLRVVVAKKDWLQRNVPENLPDPRTRAPESVNVIFLLVLMFGMTMAAVIITLILVASRREWDPTRLS
jgi:hypothetical protein